MQQITKEMASKPCPKCNTVGGMYIAVSSYTISCRNCKSTFLDPFESGPWDAHTMIIDLLGEEQIVRRVPNTIEETQDDAEKMQFYKFLYEKKGSELS